MVKKEKEIFDGISPDEEEKVIEKMPLIKEEEAEQPPSEKPKKEKKKRPPLSEERKNQLKLQLQKGRETSARNRAAKALEKKIKKEDEQKKRAKVIADYNEKNDKTKNAMS